MQSKTGDIPTELDHAAACLWVSGGKLTYTQMMGNEAELPPDAVIEACINDVDRTLIRRNLTLTVEERLIQLAGL